MDEFISLDLRIEEGAEVFSTKLYYLTQRTSYWRRAAFVIAGSFHAPFLKAFKAARPQYQTSLMLGTVFDLDETVLLSQRYQCDVVHPCWESCAPYPHRLLSREGITLLHGAGLEVILWHEEDEDELRHLLGLGVDGICTNDPRRLKNLRNRS